MSTFLLAPSALPRSFRDMGGPLLLFSWAEPLAQPRLCAYFCVGCRFCPYASPCVPPCCPLYAQHTEDIHAPRLQ